MRIDTKPRMFLVVGLLVATEALVWFFVFSNGNFASSKTSTAPVSASPSPSPTVDGLKVTQAYPIKVIKSGGIDGGTDIAIFNADGTVTFQNRMMSTLSGKATLSPEQKTLIESSNLPTESGNFGEPYPDAFGYGFEYAGVEIGAVEGEIPAELSNLVVVAEGIWREQVQNEAS